MLSIRAGTQNRLELSLRICVVVRKLIGDIVAISFGNVEPDSNVLRIRESMRGMFDNLCEFGAGRGGRLIPRGGCAKQIGIFIANSCGCAEADWRHCCEFVWPCGN